MHHISVIIVSWNAREHLRNCLRSIRKTGDPLVREVIVVDNASTDGSPEMVEEQFPDATLIKAEKNLGFARANNLGIQRASGSLLALVNSDVIVHRDCFERLTRFLESHPDVGLVGPRVVGGDGRLQLTCGRLPTVWNTACRFLALDRILARWSWFSGFEMRHFDHNSCAEVEVLSGCFWLARRDAVKIVGGLDEGFFFYAEDLDWCKRFRSAGWKIMFVAEASATHFGGGSSSNSPSRFNIEMMRGNLIYWRKHHGVIGRSLYFLLSMMRHSVRLVAHGLLRFVLRDSRGESALKLKEDLICLRWLLTGKGT
ncbi:MAG TPA: glycosyltransferase family 2 protein [Candidatus Angelobacter sp.]|nr:glycosyltransferase family 2 protein [Candidatus Angelobacter sp.]